MKKEMELTNYELLKQQGRLIILPDLPKKGRTLYWIWGDMVMPVIYKGPCGGYHKDGKFYATYTMTTKKPRTFKHYRSSWTYEKGDKRLFTNEDVGRTIFTDRKEAERVLAEKDCVSE